MKLSYFDSAHMQRVYAVMLRMVAPRKWSPWTVGRRITGSLDQISSTCTAQSNVYKYFSCYENIPGPPRRIIDSLDQILQPYLVLPAMNGPTLGMVFSKRVEANNRIELFSQPSAGLLRH